MIVLAALLLLVVLLLWRYREHYVEISGPGERPSKTTSWLSKIDAAAPIGGNDDDYLKVLQSFYDLKWKPLRDASPNASISDTEVEAFLKSADAQVPGVDPNAMRKIIAAGFSVQLTGSAAAREEKQIKFQPSKALEPTDGVDQVYNRKESIYTPTDSRIGELPEGVYPDVFQQPQPRREGVYDDRSISWTDTAFYSVCTSGPCTRNVL